MSGASSVEEIEKYLEAAGFTDIEITTKEVSEEYRKKWSLELNVGEYVMAASIKARKA